MCQAPPSKNVWVRHCSNVNSNKRYEKRITNIHFINENFIPDPLQWPYYFKPIVLYLHNTNRNIKRPKVLVRKLPVRSI